jgi:hypothetical protein
MYINSNILKVVTKHQTSDNKKLGLPTAEKLISTKIGHMGHRGLDVLW